MDNERQAFYGIGKRGGYVTPENSNQYGGLVAGQQARAQDQQYWDNERARTAGGDARGSDKGSGVNEFGKLPHPHRRA